MKGSTQATVALGLGYLLGRRRKLRAATVMAVAVAAGGTGVGGVVMRRSAKLLLASGVLDKVPPQVGELVDVVRGDLVSAGKAAATAAVNNRIDSLTESLHDRAERIRNPEAAAGEGAGAATSAARATGKGTATAARGAAGGSARRLRGRRADGEPVDEEPTDDDIDEGSYPEDDYADDEYDDQGQADEGEQPDDPPLRRPATRRRPAASRTRR